MSSRRSRCLRGEGVQCVEHLAPMGRCGWHVCFSSVNRGDAQRSVAIPHFTISYAVVGCSGRAILDHLGLREGSEEEEKRNDIQIAV